MLCCAVHRPQAGPLKNREEFTIGKMPTINVQRDLLFEALGKTYSKYVQQCDNIFVEKIHKALSVFNQSS